MTDALTRLIAEAAVLAGGKHPCAILGHRWRFIGAAGRERNAPGCAASNLKHRRIGLWKTQ